MQSEFRNLVERIENNDITLSFSALKAFASSPKDFMAYKLKDKVQTDAMLLGSVLHCIVLQPDKFDKQYFVLNDNEICSQIGGAKPRATNAYKEWKMGIIEQSAGREIIEPDMYMKAFNMRNALMENAVSAKHLNKLTVKEHKVQWEYLGKRFTGYIDGANIIKEGLIIADLKKVVSAQPRKVERVIIDDMYYMQLAMYRIALKQTFDFDVELSKCYIIAVDENCHVSVNKIHADLLKYGEQRLEYYIKKFNECTFKDKWHEDYEFYSEYGGIFLVDRPAYTYK